jgi:hypothetical protein
MNEEELEGMYEKLSVVKEQIGNVFEKNDLTIGEVMSTLSAMLVDVALDSGLPPLRLVEVIVKGCQAHEAINNIEKEREEVQWLN